ncbi:putative disease resistance protein At1g50180 [Hordeum vulgare subsp. vulgare]|uniref:putative disease resistance protein At1g50180 n=1 Tax=Hordeum vulgare subsp. vulgare TaxID=112509 RepID=UPI001D1A52D6|nr:putative disease resistance protein At1g50180 [Hordeum vulgare subsp. vulgare]
MGEAAVRIVLANMNDLAIHETRFLCGVTLEVAFLKDELMRLQAYLKDADTKWRSGNARVAIWRSQIRDTSYEAENVIEAADYMEKRNRLKKGFMGAISRYASLPSDLVTLHKIGIEIQRVRRKLSEIFQSADRLKIVMDSTTVVEDESPQDFSLVHQYYEDDVVMVGFQDEHKQIVDKLVDNEKMLSVVAIVAMGGAGKTTLARKVYTSSRIKEHFEILAWVTVSQTFKGIDLLKDILKQVVEDRDEPTSIDQMNEYEVRKKMSDLLLQKRYLVALDDVWEANTWKQMNKTVQAFPDVYNGSRILLTTRKNNVSNHIKMRTIVHALQGLDEEQSWKLFSSKALPSYRRYATSDLDDFEQVGKKIAKKCEGLPLALTVLGGHLSKNFNTQAWSNLLLGWPLTDSMQMMRELIYRSYKDLPNHYLRSCFIYLAAFPEDYVISVPVLIDLWIAENFIPHKPNHILEETAHEYVTELAQRNLVQVVHRSSVHGWIEKIRIHDILRNWCIEEARQDGFLDVIDKTTGQTGASSAEIMIPHRSCFQTLSGQIVPATPKVRTVLGFGLSSASLPKLRFLRVLHIENSSLKDLYMIIDGCIHLRCLRLRKCKHVKLPSSIGNLLYLQTIDLRGTTFNSVVPYSLWDIPTLRHVYLSDEFSPPPPTMRVHQQQQKEIRTFELILTSVGTKFRYRDMAIYLGQMKQLTTFSLIMEPISAEIISIFANMPHLVDIYLVKFCVINKLSAEFPQSLRRLVVEADAITEDPMPVIEKLPCLVVLELSGYKGHTMCCSAQGFSRLQELALTAFSTAEWKIEVGSMPKLSRMTLRYCECMSRLPQGLLHLPNLGYLKLEHMPQIAEDDNMLRALMQKGCEVKWNR